MLHSCLFKSLKAAVVYDPNEEVIRNVAYEVIFISSEDELKMVAKTADAVMLCLVEETSSAIDLGAFGAIISRQSLPKTGLREMKLRYFEGHYKTIRFAFPDTLKTPIFYNVKGEKFEYPVYKQWFDRVCMSLGYSALAAPSKFHIYSNLEEWDASPFFINSEEYIFTKQASVFSVEGKEIISVEKISDSERGNELLSTEANVLRALEPLLKEDVLKIPKVLHVGNSLLLSNNHPNGAEMTDQLEDLHLMALGAVYEADTGITAVSKFLDNNNYINMIKAFKLILMEELHPKGLSRQHLEEIAIDLLSLMNRLDGRETVYTSVYHGSFTPQNCLKKNGLLHLNNFGKCEADKPLLFDAFYYIFHQVEQQPMPNMGEFDDIMKHLFKNKKLMSLIEKHEINFKLNLSLFHVHHIINKIESFLKQKFINPNVNFTLQFYKQALERMNHVEIQS